MDESLCEDEQTLTETEKTEIMAYFKRCVLPKEIKEVEKKMAETKYHRRKMILEEFETYRNCWQFYFVCPTLVRDYLVNSTIIV